MDTNIDDFKKTTEYKEIKKMYDAIIDNKKVINRYLSDFIVNGVSIGEEAYGEILTSNEDINLPNDLSKYNNALRAIEEDMTEIDKLLKKTKNILEEYETESNSTNPIVTELSQKLMEVYNLRLERETVYNRLIAIRNIIDKQNKASESQMTGKRKDPFKDKSAVDITGIFKLPEKDAIKSRSEGKSRLKNNKEEIGKILSNIVVGGEVAGKGVYNKGETSIKVEDNYDLPSIILGIALINQDLDDIDEYVKSIDEEIEEKKAKRNEKRDVIDKETGKVIDTEYVLSESEREQLNDEIKKLKEEKEKWVGEDGKGGKRKERKEIKKYLQGLYNALNKHMGDNADLYTASSILNSCTQDENGKITSLTIGGKTFSQAEAGAIFENLSQYIGSNKDKYQLVDDYEGERRPEGFEGIAKKEYNSILQSLGSAFNSIRFDATLGFYSNLTNYSQHDADIIHDWEKGISDLCGNIDDVKNLQLDDIGYFSLVKDHEVSGLENNDDKREMAAAVFNIIHGYCDYQMVTNNENLNTEIKDYMIGIDSNWAITNNTIITDQIAEINEKLAGLYAQKLEMEQNKVDQADQKYQKLIGEIGTALSAYSAAITNSNAFNKEQMSYAESVFKNENYDGDWFDYQILNFDTSANCINYNLLTQDEFYSRIDELLKATGADIVIDGVIYNPLFSLLSKQTELANETFEFSNSVLNSYLELYNRKNNTNYSQEKLDMLNSSAAIWAITSGQNVGTAFAMTQRRITDIKDSAVTAERQKLEELYDTDRDALLEKLQAAATDLENAGVKLTFEYDKINGYIENKTLSLIPHADIIKLLEKASEKSADEILKSNEEYQELMSRMHSDLEHGGFTPDGILLADKIASNESEYAELSKRMSDLFDAETTKQIEALIAENPHIYHYSPFFYGTKADYEEMMKSKVANSVREKLSTDPEYMQLCAQIEENEATRRGLSSYGEYFYRIADSLVEQNSEFLKKSQQLEGVDGWEIEGNIETYDTVDSFSGAPIQENIAIKTLRFYKNGENGVDKEYFELTPEEAAIYFYNNREDIPKEKWSFFLGNYTMYDELKDISICINNEQFDKSRLPLLTYYYNTLGDKSHNYITNRINDLIDDSTLIEGRRLAYERINALNNLNNAVEAGLFVLGDGFGDGLQQFAEGIHNALVYCNGKTTSKDYKNQYLRQFFTEEYGKGYQTLYEFSSMMANMAPSIALSVILANAGAPLLFGVTASELAKLSETGKFLLTLLQIPGMSLMGVSAGGNYQKEGLQEGMTRNEAATYGILAGLAEVVLERILGSMPGLSNMEKFEGMSGLTGFLARAHSEGQEEFFQDVLNPFFKAIAKNGKDAEGKDMSLGDIWKEINWSAEDGAIYSYLMGAASGGFMGGGSLIVDTYSYATTGNSSTVRTLYSMNLQNILSNSQSGHNLMSYAEVYSQALNQTFDNIQILSSMPSEKMTALKTALSTNADIVEQYNKYAENKGILEKVTFKEYINELTAITALQITENAELESINATIEKNNARIAEINESLKTKQENLEKSLKKANDNTLSKKERTKAQNIANEVQKVIDSMTHEVETLESKNIELAKENIEAKQVELAANLAEELFPPNAPKLNIKEKIDAFIEEIGVKNTNFTYRTPTQFVVYLNERIETLEKNIQNAEERLTKYGETSEEVRYLQELKNELEDNNDKLEKIKQRFSDLNINYNQVNELIEKREKIINNIAENQRELEELQEKLDKLDKNTSEYEALKEELEQKLQNARAKVNINLLLLENISRAESSINNHVDIRDIINQNENDSLRDLIEDIVDETIEENENPVKIEETTETEINYQNYLKLLEQLKVFENGIKNLRTGIISTEEIKSQIKALEEQAKEVAAKIEKLKQQLLDSGIDVKNLDLQKINMENILVKLNSELQQIDAIQNEAERNNQNVRRMQIVKEIAKIEANIGQLGLVPIVNNTSSDNTQNSNGTPTQVIINGEEKIENNEIIENETEKIEDQIIEKIEDTESEESTENNTENDTVSEEEILINNHEVEVIKVSELNTDTGNRIAKIFNRNVSYQEYDYVVIPKTSLSDAINAIINSKFQGKVLLEINNTLELTPEVIELIPSNVEVRINGAYTESFLKSFKTIKDAYTTLKKVTYTKTELQDIMDELQKFDKGINSEWSNLEKAKYAYDYLTDRTRIEYTEKPPGNNQDRPQQYDSLMSLVMKDSTCQGFAHTYQALLERMGIECYELSGRPGEIGAKRNSKSHAFNAVVIDGQIFLVDTVRESLNELHPGKYPGTGFGVKLEFIPKYNIFKNQVFNLENFNSEASESGNIVDLREQIKKEQMLKEKRQQYQDLIEKNNRVLRMESELEIKEENGTLTEAEQTLRHEIENQKRENARELSKLRQEINDIEKNATSNIENINSEVADITKVENLDMEQRGNDDSKANINLNQSLRGFDYVIKPKGDLQTTLNSIIATNDIESKVLIELTTIEELNSQLLESLPDNISFRISPYAENYLLTLKAPHFSGNKILLDITYNKSEIQSIIKVVENIKANINSNWNDYQKAKYIYDYLKENIAYNVNPGEISVRAKQFDGLMNLVVKESTCQGFAHTYKVLLNSLGIECDEVWGALNNHGQHAYNVVKINDEVFIVDTVREELNKTKEFHGQFPGTGFGVSYDNIKNQYTARTNTSLLKETNCDNTTLNNGQFTETNAKVVNIVEEGITIGEKTLQYENIMEILNNKRSLTNALVSNTMLGVKTSEVLKALANAQLNGANIKVSERLQNVLNVYNTLKGNEVLYNQSEVSHGVKPIIISDSLVTKYGEENINKIIERINSNKVLDDSVETAVFLNDIANINKDLFNAFNVEVLQQVILEEKLISANELFNNLLYYNQDNLIIKLLKNHFNEFTENILPNISFNIVSEHISIKDLANLSQEQLQILNEKAPILVEAITSNIEETAKQIIHYTNSQLFNRFLNFENNQELFGNIPREQYIQALYDNLVTDDYLLDRIFQIRDYLQIDGLKEMLLDNTDILKAFENFTWESFVDLLNDEYIYDKVSKKSDIFYEYSRQALSDYSPYTITSKIANDILINFDAIQNYQTSKQISLEQLKICLLQSDIIVKYINNNSLITTENVDEVMNYFNAIDFLNREGIDTTDVIGFEEISALNNQILKVIIDNTPHDFRIKLYDSSPNSQSGVDQHAVANAMHSFNEVLKTKLINQVKSKYHGISTQMAVRFLRSMELAENTKGICNYADVCNAIFEYYLKIGEQEFEKAFGFPMYVDGKLNDTQLLADAFINITGDELITKNENGIYIAATTNEGYKGVTYIDPAGTYSIERIIDYLKSKGLDANSQTITQKNIFNSNNKTSTQITGFKNYPHRIQTNRILLQISAAIGRGEHVSITSRTGLNLTNIQNGLTYQISEAHIMSIYGIDANGNILVDSWGKRYSINIEAALNNDVYIQIDTLSIDFTRNATQDIETDTTDVIVDSDGEYLTPNEVKIERAWQRELSERLNSQNTESTINNQNSNTSITDTVYEMLKQDNVDYGKVISLIESQPVSVRNDIIDSLGENISQIYDKVSPEILIDYLASDSALKNSNITGNSTLLSQIYDLLKQQNYLDTIRNKVSNGEFTRKFSEFCLQNDSYSINLQIEFLKMPELTPYFCQDTKGFQYIFDSLINRYFDKFSNTILSNIDTSELHKYLNILNIDNMTEETRTKFETHYPGVIDRIIENFQGYTIEEIIDNPYKQLFKKFVDYDNHKILFQKYTKREYIQMFYDYLTKSENVKKTVTFLNYYAQIDELRDLLFTNNEVITLVNNSIGNDILDLFENDLLYLQINTESQAFRTYANHVINGKRKLHPERITNIVNSYSKNYSKLPMSPAVAKQIFEYYFGDEQVRNAYINNINNLSSEEIQGLIDYLEVLTLITNNCRMPESNNVNTEYDKLIGSINNLLGEENQQIDETIISEESYNKLMQEVNELYTNLINNEIIYSHIDKLSKVYYQYANDVLSGKLEFRQDRLADIINGYRNSSYQADISNEIANKLQDIISNSSIIEQYKNNSSTFTQSELQELIDYISIKQLLNSKNINTNIVLTIDETNSIYNFINKLILENNSIVDKTHMQAVIYNFGKYYTELNNLNYNFWFYYENNRTAGQQNPNTKSISFNTKFFDTKFKTDNIFIDKLETIFHEVFHAMQTEEAYLSNASKNAHVDSPGTINKYSLLYVIDDILRDRFIKENDTYYKDNYAIISYEIDARYSSVTVLSNYVQEISPNTYKIFKQYFANILESRTEEQKQRKGYSDKDLYDTNFAGTEYNELYLNRDMILDRIILENPTHLDANPILKYIYNEDGTRKNIFELQEVIKNNSQDKNIVNMINYWIRTSKYSINSLIEELYAIRTAESLSDETIDYIYQIATSKFMETMLLESNYFADNSFRDSIEDKILSYVNEDGSNLEAVTEFEEAILKNYDKFYQQFNENPVDYLISLKNYNLIVNYVKNNINNHDVIKEIALKCDYETWIGILNNNIDQLDKVAPYLIENRLYLKTVLDNNLNIRFEACQKLLKTIDINHLHEYVTAEQIATLSPENKVKFENLFPGVIEKITNQQQNSQTDSKIYSKSSTSQTSKSSTEIVDNIKILDTESAFITKPRYKSNPNSVTEDLSLKDIIEILVKNIESNKYNNNLKYSFRKGEVSDNGKLIGISMDQVIDDIIEARNHGINIEVSENIDALINAKNNLESGETLLNFFDVYNGQLSIILTKDGLVKMEDGTLIDVNKNFNKFKENQNNLSTSDIESLLDTMKAYELLVENNLTESITTDINVMDVYNYINELFFSDNTYGGQNTLNFVYAFTKYFARINGIKVNVDFYNSNESFGYSNDGTVGLNVLRAVPSYNNTYIQTLETVFHEVFHELQHQEVTLNINSKYNLGNTIEIILKKHNAAYYEYNYDDILFEVDARYNSYQILLNYLQNHAPSKYSEYLEYYQDKLIKESELYNKNTNSFKTDAVTLNRDVALENIIAENPNILNEHPILKNIFNEDGTRKTVFELMEVIKENNNIKPMVDYWLKTSNYSIESIINEYYQSCINDISTLPSEYQEYIINSLENKFISTMISEGNTTSIDNIKNKITESISKIEFNETLTANEFIKLIDATFLKAENEIKKAVNKKKGILRRIFDTIRSDNPLYSVSTNIMDGDEYLTETELAEQAKWQDELASKLRIEDIDLRIDALKAKKNIELKNTTLSSNIEKLNKQITELEKQLESDNNNQKLLDKIAKLKAKVAKYIENKIESEKLLAMYQKGLEQDTNYRVLNHESFIRELAKEIHDKAIEFSKTIVEDMHSLETEDMYLVGEENQIKTVNSIARKINEDAIRLRDRAIKEQIPYDVKELIKQSASNIADSLRYTMLLDIDSYVSNFNTCIEQLEKMGYIIIGIKNAWTNPKLTTYNGINVKLSKQVGNEIINLELQFHTEESYLTKENFTHDIYKVERNQLSSKDNVLKAHKIQVKLQSLVDIPKDIKTIKDYKYNPNDYVSSNNTTDTTIRVDATDNSTI